LHGASVLRVHDVKENWQALSVVDALLKIRRNRDVYA
jgi:dihydropteroate synthase